MANQEVTELVDVRDVSEALENEQIEAAASESESIEPYLERQSHIALIRERFAAFLIDSLILFYLYVAIGTLAYRAFYGSWMGPIPCFGWQGLATQGGFIFAAFIYYFLFEAVFYSTPGKFLCWMYVRRKNGDLASMSSIFFRQVFRPLDYLLAPLTYILMEMTGCTQKLGDLISGTIVIKKSPAASEHYHLNASNIASASGRALSFLIDLLIVGPMTAGFILMMSDQTPMLNRWILILSPLVPLVYFSVSEALCHTSPGKWLFGYVVCHEDGFKVTFPAAVVRSFMRLFDTNPVALIVMWMSPKRQRFGDLAADTVVSSQGRKWMGGTALALSIVASITLFWAGWTNNANFIKSDDFNYEFLPTLEIFGSLGGASEYKQLTIDHMRIASNEAGTIRMPAQFKPGETVYVISDVYGFERRKRMVWLQEDIEVKYPDGSIGLHQENIVDYHQVVTGRGPVELTNSIKIPETVADGPYIVTITVRDLYSYQRATVKQQFDVYNPDRKIQEQPTSQIPSTESPQPAVDEKIQEEDEIQEIPAG